MVYHMEEEKKHWWDTVLSFIQKEAEPVLFITTMYQIAVMIPYPALGSADFQKAIAAAILMINAAVYLIQQITLDVSGASMIKQEREWTFKRIFGVVLVSTTIISVTISVLVGWKVINTDQQASIEHGLVLARAILSVIYGALTVSSKHKHTLPPQPPQLGQAPGQNLDVQPVQINKKVDSPNLSTWLNWTNATAHEVDATGQDTGQQSGQLDATGQDTGQQSGQLDTTGQDTGQQSGQVDATGQDTGQQSGQVDATGQDTGLDTDKLTAVRTKLHLTLLSTGQDTGQQSGQLDTDKLDTVSTEQMNTKKQAQSGQLDTGQLDAASSIQKKTSSVQKKTSSVQKKTSRLSSVQIEKLDKYLQDHPGCTARELADEVGCSPTTANNYKNKREAQLIQIGVQSM